MNLICIPALKEHTEHLKLNLSRLGNLQDNYTTIIVTPNKNDFKNILPKYVEIFEDQEFLDVNKSFFKNYLNGGKKQLYKWYYQQILKYSIVLKLTNQFRSITIVDADSIILNKALLSPKIIFVNSNEYHTPYFQTIEALFPEISILNRSAINNFQTYSSKIFVKMIKEIEESSKENWINRILELINNSNDIRSFSEYETYANYASYYYELEKLPIKFYRRGDLLNRLMKKEKIINELSSLGYDIVAFEVNHKIGLIHKMYSIYLLITFKIRRYVKYFFSQF